MLQQRLYHQRSGALSTGLSHISQHNAQPAAYVWAHILCEQLRQTEFNFITNGHYVIHADSTGPYVDIRHRSRIVGTCRKRNKLKRTRIHNGRLTGTEIRYVIPRVMRSIRFLNGPAKREVCLKAVLLDYFTLPGTFDIFRENTSNKWRFAFPLQREGKKYSNYIYHRKVFRRNTTETAYLFNFNFTTVFLSIFGLKRSIVYYAKQYWARVKYKHINIRIENNSM